jgi:replicative DNA helicase
MIPEQQHDSGATSRRVPHDEGAEQAVLGSILLDPDALVEAERLIGPESFWRERHRVIFQALIELRDSDEAIDLVTLTEHLRTRGLLERVGSVPYLVGLADNTPTAAHLTSYARIVRQKAILRDLIATSQKVIALAASGEGDPEEIIGAAQGEVTHLLTRGTRGDFQTSTQVASDTADYISELLRAKDGLTGITTGFLDLDRLLHGWQPGALNVVAARPSMGKSAFALQAAYAAARSGKKVAVFSLEMPSRDLALRIVCGETRISLERVRRGAVSQRDHQRLADGLATFAETPMWFNDLSDLTLNEIRTKVRAQFAREGVDLLVVDYLQLLSGGRGEDRGENRQQEVSIMSRGFKMLARELGIPVVVLSQLSRQVESRPNKRPILSDLRESGAIEQDADVVMFLYRDDYYDAQSEHPGSAEVIVAKHRNGALDTVKLVWTAEHVAFRNMDRRPEASAGAVL